MRTSKLSAITVGVLSITFFCASAISNTDSEETNQPLSLVYGFKEGESKSIYLSDQDGNKRLKVVSATLSDGYPAMSPSGKLIAFYGKYDDFRTWSIHTVDVDGSNVRRLTDVKHVWDSAPAWSPDGKTIIFAREYEDENGDWQEEVWLMNPDGTEQRQLKNIHGRAAEFMHDGRILFQSGTKPRQIFISDIDGSNQVQLTFDDTDNMSPKISPDGKQIAYLSNRDGNQEVYVMNIDGSGQTRITSNRVEEWDPAWSVDGAHVFFSSQNVHGFYNIFKAKKDGSEIKQVLENGSQAATVFHVDEGHLKRLLKNNQ